MFLPIGCKDLADHWSKSEMEHALNSKDPLLKGFQNKSVVAGNWFCVFENGQEWGIKIALL